MSISSLSNLFEQSGLQLECALTGSEVLCDRYCLSVMPSGTDLRYSFNAKLPTGLQNIDAQERALMDLFLSWPRSGDIDALIHNHMHVITQDFAVIFAESYLRLGVNMRTRRAIATAINAEMHSMDYCVQPETVLPARDVALQEVASYLHQLGFTQAVRGIVAADSLLSAGRSAAEAAASIALVVMTQECDGLALVDRRGQPCTLNMHKWTQGLARLRHVTMIVKVLRHWKSLEEVREPYFSRYIEGFLHLANIDTRHGKHEHTTYTDLPKSFASGEVLAIRTVIYETGLNPDSGEQEKLDNRQGV